MRISRLSALVIGVAAALPMLAAAESIAVVNGTSIDKQELDRAVSTVIQSSNGQTADTPQLREDLKNRLINREVILQEARRRGLDKNANVVNAVAEANMNILQDALFGDIVKQQPVAESAIRARYDSLVAKYKNSREVHASQIVLSTEGDAEKAIADLKKGSRFDQIARTRSLDPSAKQSGGDIGWNNLDMVPPMLANALKDLKKGQVSPSPLRTNVGWHVFKVEDVRPAQIPPYEQIKPQLQRQLVDEEINKAVSDLRSKAQIQ
jgi:peptidyl-prolyl cis-trans isomerase C